MSGRGRLAAAALAAALAGGGCDARSVNTAIDPAKITYARDARTGLCFAALGRAKAAGLTDLADSFTMTAVPCSPEVLALVPRAQGGRS